MKKFKINETQSKSNTYPILITVAKFLKNSWNPWKRLYRKFLHILLPSNCYFKFATWVSRFRCQCEQQMPLVGDVMHCRWLTAWLVVDWCVMAAAMPTDKLGYLGSVTLTPYHTQSMLPWVLADIQTRSAQAGQSSFTMSGRILS